jgi:glycosyltransferase involved in cell wall biosynthesis
MTDMLITIITATYNSEDVLENCIKSIISQTYKNIEYIIIDGASTDNTLAIINKYNANISKWISEKDTGVYDAWNKGVKLATGEWIMFVGSDDFLYPDALENYFNFLSESKEQFEFISAKMRIIDENKQTVRTLGNAWAWEKSRKIFNIAHPGSLHSASLFKKIGIFDSKYKICGDYDLLLRSGKHFKTGFMDKVILEMSLGGLSDSSKVLFESNRVIRNTGGVNFFQAGLIFVLQYTKFLVRKSFFRLKIYPYKK